MNKTEQSPDGSAGGDSLPLLVGQWRDAATDPPAMTGKILVWVPRSGPAIVNVEERWMSYWTHIGESDPTAPFEWDWWCEIPEPNVKAQGMAREDETIKSTGDTKHE